MEESDTYLMILDEGRVMHAKKTIIIVGEDRLGPADDSVRMRVESIQDLERLNRMIRRAVKVATWQEILDTP